MGITAPKGLTSTPDRTSPRTSGNVRAAIDFCHDPVRGDEERVIEAFCAFLNEQGWQTEREVGFIDVVAQKDGRRILAEAKGRTAAIGLDVDTMFGAAAPPNAEGAPGPQHSLRRGRAHGGLGRGQTSARLGSQRVEHRSILRRARRNCRQTRVTSQRKRTRKSMVGWVGW